MKKFFSGLIVLVCLVAFAGLAFAEKEKEYRFKQSILNEVKSYSK